MYLAIDSQPSCARAWVAAASAVAEVGEAYNVVIDVEDPVHHSESDSAVIKLVDSFLRERNAPPIATITNTIFPQALYEKHGAPKFYDEYAEVYGKLTISKNWGRYFDRLMRRKGSNGKFYYPLQELIEKMQQREAADRRYKAVYELAIYDPELDRKRLRNAPCLSFLSFKRHPERGLTLTAVYRNQAYITRCLGNLIGLGRLQSFVAAEVGITVGPLTCVSTHAELDAGDGWGINDARTLVRSSVAILAEAN